MGTKKISVAFISSIFRNDYDPTINVLSLELLAASTSNCYIDLILSVMIEDWATTNNLKKFRYLLFRYLIFEL